VSDIKDLWRDDLVSFFLGCSFGFERALQKNDIEVRNITECKNVSMYITNIQVDSTRPSLSSNKMCSPTQCTAVGPFNCPMVVSMRPIPQDKLADTIAITGKHWLRECAHSFRLMIFSMQGNYSLAHGEPIHVGDPVVIGIQDLSKVDFGDAVTIRPGETPVFWACGVTSALAALSASMEITSSPVIPFRKQNLRLLTALDRFRARSGHYACPWLHGTIPSPLDCSPTKDTINYWVIDTTMHLFCLLPGSLSPTCRIQIVSPPAPHRVTMDKTRIENKLFFVTTMVGLFTCNAIKA